MIPTPRAFSSPMTRNSRLDLLVAQRGSGLVHDEDPRIGPQRPGDLDELLLGHRQPADVGLRVDCRTDPIQQPPGPLPPLIHRTRRPQPPGSSPIAMFSATVRSGKSAGCW